MKVAKLVRRNTRPVFTHDCDQCRFVGRLDGQDLYVCHDGSFLRRFGSEVQDNGSLGDFSPPGSPYSLAREITRRGLPPHEYRTQE